MLLLDTCALLWLSSDPDKLSHHAKELITQYADELFISAISAFEIAVKAEKKKLILPLKPLPWFERVLEFHGIEEIPVNSTILVRAAELPPLHQDPCDRILIATSQTLRLKLLTPDPLIKKYPGVHTDW